MIWNECSLNVSDTCGCAAWHVAPTPRTVMRVAMQARSVRRVLQACQIRWFRRVARALGSPSAQSSPAPTSARQVRKGAQIILLGNVATSGLDSGAVRIYAPSTVGTACRGLQVSTRGRGVTGGIADGSPSLGRHCRVAHLVPRLIFHVSLVSLVPSHLIFYVLLVSLVEKERNSSNYFFLLASDTSNM